MNGSGASRPHILMATDVPASRDTGMGRHQWFLARELERRGFAVREFYGEDVSGGRPGPWRRFKFPLAVLREALRGPGEGRGYALALVHEGSAAAVCLARCLGLLPVRCIAMSHNPEQKVWELNLKRAARGGLPIAWRSRLIWPLTRLLQSNFALRHADAVLCLSEEDAKFIRNRYARSPDCVRCIRNGVEDRFFEFRCVCPQPRILFLGTWLPLKGIHELRQSLAAVLERQPEAQASLMGVGLPDEVVRNEFPEKLRGRMQIVSRVAPDDLPALFASHNIFVLPSWYEGMPLALLEAMAAGLAPLVTAVGGMRDIIHDGIDGLSVPPDDAGALTEALQRLCSDGELRARLGVAAQERARSFTWERAGEQLAGILRTVAGDRTEVSKLSETSECTHPSKTHS